jgi:phosphodiesterase/alkaline phosphatase D-like protein
VLVALAVAVVLCLFPSGAAAASSVVSGDVTNEAGSAVGLDGTEVAFRDISTQTVVASAATEMNGGYEATVPEGVYEVTFTPPFASGYRSTSVNAFAVSGGNAATLSVTLVHATPKISKATWSGVLRGVGGVPLPGYTVRTSSPYLGTFTATTDDEGAFSVKIGQEEGDELVVEGSRPSGVPRSAVPGFVAFHSRVSVASGSVQHDLNLPLHDVAVQAVGPSHGPVAGVQVTYSIPGEPAAGTLGGGTEALSVGASDSGATGEGGTTEFAFPDTDASTTINLTPPSEHGLEGASFSITGRNLTGEPIHEVQLQAAPVKATWTGVLRGAGNVVLPGYTVRTNSPYLGAFQTTTDEHGSFTVPIGQEQGDELTVEGNRPSGVPRRAVPAYIVFRSTVSVSSSTVNQPLTLPLHDVKVQTLSPSHEPVAGVQVEYRIPSYQSAAGTLGGGTEALSVGASDGGATGEGGTTEFAFPDTSTTVPINLTPPAEAGLKSASFDLTSVFSELLQEVQLEANPPKATWTGVLRGAGNVVLPGYTVRTNSPYLGAFQTTTDEHGSFTVPIGQEQGDELTVEGNRPSGVPRRAVPAYIVFRSTVSVSSSTVNQPLTLPLHDVKVQTLSPSHEPVAGVQVEYRIPSYQSAAGTLGGGTEALSVGASDGGATGEGGTTEFAFPDTSTTVPINLTPPAESGLVSAVFDLLRVAGNETHILSFDSSSVDVVPPEVSCDSLSPGWHASNVTVHCTASDSRSGLVNPAQEASFSVTTAVEAGQETSQASTGERRVCDVAGNCTWVGPYGPYEVDLKAPAITISSPQEGAEIPHGAKVDAEFTCTDGGSGVAKCKGPTGAGEPLPTETAGTYSLHVSSQDAVGNESSAEHHYVVLPAPPTVATEGTSLLTAGSATLEATVNPNGGVVKECFFEYGETTSYNKRAECATSLGAGAGPVTVSAAIAGLSPDTTYHYRIIAGNAGGPSMGADRTFATSPSAPKVLTGTATYVGQTSATLNATVDPEGTEVTDCQFEYGTSGSYGHSLPCSTSPGSGTGPVSVSASATGLDPNTTYHFRIAATNAGGTSKGTDETFSTSPSPPSVLTREATEVGRTSARLNGTVGPEGTSTDCHFEYWSAGHAATNVPCSPPPGSGTSPVEVSAQVTGLEPNSEYHYRVVAENAGGPNQGSVQTFTTPPNPPRAVTEAASEVVRSSATLNGKVYPEGATVTDCHFEYGTTPSYGHSVPCSPSPASGEAEVAVSAALAGLQPGTTYYFRLVATNVGGTGYGSPRSFGTVPNPPGVVTGGASPVGRVSATLNATVDPEGAEVTECHFAYGTTTSYGHTASCSPLPGSGTTAVSVSAQVTGLSPSTPYHFRIVAKNAGGESVGTDLTLTTLPPAKPTVATGSATSLTPNGAMLNATVDPNELAVTECRFEYGPTTSYGHNASCSPSPGAGAEPVAVAAAIGALSANTTYHYRVVATNAAGTSDGADQTLTTLPNLPIVVTRGISSLSASSATLEATVDPNGAEVSDCHFEYGPTTSYGGTAPCSPAPGSGTSQIAVTGAVKGLSPDTIYHYRIAATNGGGTSYGAEQSFKTWPVLEVGRCVKPSGLATGRYHEGGCIEPSAGEDTGAYEWQPWPLANSRFDFKSNGVATLESATRVTLTCHHNTLAGQYTGLTTATATITLSGCEGTRVLSGTCATEGAQPGELMLNPLDAQLGVIKAGATPTIGWSFAAASAANLARFKCGTGEVTLTGSVIGPVGQTKALGAVDAMAPSSTLKFTGAKGLQKPEAFEGGAKATLAFVTAGKPEPVRLRMKSVMQDEELLEIRAIG